MPTTSHSKAGVEAFRLDLSVDQFRDEVAFLQTWVVDADDRIRLLPADFYLSQPPTRVALWGIMLGMFVIPTLELVAWLHHHVIRGRRAVEVGAGLGDLARFLGIVSTDSYHIVEDPGTRLRFFHAGHPIPQLRQDDTERLTAEQAVEKYKPEVVIAAWSVEKSPTSGVIDPIDTSWGIDERAIVGQADYCLLGHLAPHRGKRVLQLANTELQLPCLVSRAVNRTGNRVWLFNAGARPGGTVA